MRIEKSLNIRTLLFSLSTVGKKQNKTKTNEGRKKKIPEFHS